MNNEKPFDIGIIVKPQGLNGETRVLPTTDEPGRFSLLETVLIEKNNEIKQYKIENVRPHGNMLLIKFAGVNDRNAAELLNGAVIKIPADIALPLGDDEYYIRDLIDMEVFTDESKKIGVIRDVLITGANDVYVVKTPDGREILIPAIKECILSVSVKNNRMDIHLMDGLDT